MILKLSAGEPIVVSSVAIAFGHNLKSNSTHQISHNSQAF